MQNALVGEVTPELRAVVINIDLDEEIFYAWFYYDGSVSEERIDLWECVISEATAHIPECFIKSRVMRLDYPEKIPPGGYCAYMRKEEGAAEYAASAFSRVKIKEMSMAYDRLALLDAMLGIVTPELRAVIVDFNKEQTLFYIRFFYHGEVPRILLELWQNAILKTKNDFAPNCDLDGKVERVDYPNPIPFPTPFRGWPAYRRKEARL